MCVFACCGVSVFVSASAHAMLEMLCVVWRLTHVNPVDVDVDDDDDDSVVSEFVCIFLCR